VIGVRILYLTDGRPDYMADDLLYGLRAILGADVVDYPRKDVLYASSRLRDAAADLYGRGFHCFGLEDLEVDRSDLGAKVRNGYFDAIINSSAWRIACPLHPQLVVIDGEDHQDLTAHYLGRVPLYFKRELRAPRSDLEPILFALPDFLYDAEPLPRTQQVHAAFRLTSDVRRELAASFAPRDDFQTWREYQADIRRSWFAISPRGAGYDCQRHYEILGQAVLCVFLDAQAPYRLRQSFVDNDNCLSFSSAAQLRDKIERCRQPQRLVERGRESLLSQHLASKRAAQVLTTVASAPLAARHLRLVEAARWETWLRWQARRHAAYEPPRRSKA
jgi:hypothetical protein